MPFIRGHSLSTTEIHAYKEKLHQTKRLGWAKVDTHIEKQRFSRVKLEILSSPLKQSSDEP